MLILGLKGLNNTKKCSSRKHPYSLCRGERKFQGGWGGGSQRPKNLKLCMKLIKIGISSGEGIGQIPSVGGGVDIF